MLHKTQFAKSSETFYDKIYSRNISALCIEKWMKRLLKNRHNNDKKYDSVLRFSPVISFPKRE